MVNCLRRAARLLFSLATYGSSCRRVRHTRVSRDMEDAVSPERFELDSDLQVDRMIELGFSVSEFLCFELSAHLDLVLPTALDLTRVVRISERFEFGFHVLGLVLPSEKIGACWSWFSRTEG